jgi:hypothetical protein
LIIYGELKTLSRKMKRENLGWKWELICETKTENEGINQNHLLLYHGIHILRLRYMGVFMSLAIFLPFVVGGRGRVKWFTPNIVFMIFRIFASFRVLMNFAMRRRRWLRVVRPVVMRRCRRQFRVLKPVVVRKRRMRVVWIRVAVVRRRVKIFGLIIMREGFWTMVVGRVRRVFVPIVSRKPMMVGIVLRRVRIFRTNVVESWGDRRSASGMLKPGDPSREGRRCSDGWDPPSGLLPSNGLFSPGGLLSPEGSVPPDAGEPCKLPWGVPGCKEGPDEGILPDEISGPEDSSDGDLWEPPWNDPGEDPDGGYPPGALLDSGGEESWGPA